MVIILACIISGDSVIQMLLIFGLLM